MIVVYNVKQKAGLSEYRAVKGTERHRQQLEMWSGSNKGQTCVCCLPVCQQSVDRTLQCALCPRGAGWVAEYRNRGSKGERGGQDWQGAVWSGNRSFWITQIPSIQLESCSLLHAGRIWRGKAFNPERAPTKEQAKVAAVMTVSQRKRKRGRETTTLQLGYQ